MASNKGRNVCLTLHQPWASLLVQGIKRIEGRSWPCPREVTGRLWIHAASKVPDASTIEAMEEFYRQIYEVDGVTEIEFPKHYPVSVLLGCVNIVGCLENDQLAGCEKIPIGVRMEGQTPYCWLCEDPQKLVIPLEMRGSQRVYNLPNVIADAALRGLRPAKAPALMKFPQLEPSDLVPRELGPSQSGPNVSRLSSPNSSSQKLDASIAGARNAALQFKKDDDRRSSIGNSPLWVSGKKLSDQFNLDKSHGADRVLHGDGQSGSSGPLNPSRQAPRRVAAFRVFDKALGDLGRDLSRDLSRNSSIGGH